MYMSIDEKNDDLRKELMYAIQETIHPKLGKFLQHYKCHLGSYLVKVPNPQSLTFPHQDWLFVDHAIPEYFSATIWVSLEDISIEHGSLGFIKGSHLFLNNIIGSPSPEIRTATMGHEGLILSYLSFPGVKAGDAVIFNNKTVHAAFPNTSNIQRIAVGVGITPEPAILYHYFLKPGTTDKIYKLRVKPEFFEHYGNGSLRDLYLKGQLPEHTEVEAELDFHPTLYTAAEFEEMMIRYDNQQNGMPFADLFASYQQGGLLTKTKSVLKYALSKVFS
jgi:ectoine hydroxylase-related dioxygenase (phytanoyl-CoA dioxygenase family)